MPSSHVPRLRATLVVLAAAIICLTGCTPEARTGTEPSPVESPSSASTPNTPVPTEQATPAALDISCDELIPAQAMYDYNSNFGLLDNFQVEPSALVSQVVEKRGVACQWLNQSSGEVIDVAATRLADFELTEVRAQLAASSKVSEYGAEGYFQRVGSDGQSQVLSGPFWIVVVSEFFTEPGDSAPLVKAALESLG